MMDKMKMRMMAMGKKEGMGFSPESLAKLKAKKEGAGMESMLAKLMSGHGQEEMGEGPSSMEEEMGEGKGMMAQEDIGELSPEETKLIIAYRKKMGKMEA